MKQALAIVATTISLQFAAFAAVGVGYNANVTVGYFTSSSGASLSSGGVSVGYFTNALSTGVADSFWTGISSQSGASAWSSILSAGFRDVRSVAGSQPSDWAFPTNMIGSAGNIQLTDLPVSTRLYVIGFDNGSFSLATPASSWSGATEWGVVSAFGHTNTAENFVSGVDLSTKTLNFGSSYNLVAGDVKVGSLSPSYATTRTVLLVPEPSTYALLAMSGIAVAGYVFRRRRRA